MTIKAPTVKQVYWVQDKATGPLKKIRNEADKTAKTYTDSNGRIRDSNGRFVKSNNAVTKSLGSMSKGFIALAVAGASLKFLKDSVITFAKFEAQMNKTRAVSGATATEMQKLSNQAKELGANTALSASQVGSLQFELSKLGFTVDEIVDATDDIGKLSIALGHDLADSAGIAGRTMKQFGLEAEEMGRITNVLAEGASSSALDLTAIGESMSYVGGTASALGFDLEETTSALGALANVGISGSRAGTNLSRAFLLMHKEGSKAQKLMKGFKGDITDLNQVLEYLDQQGLSDATKAFDTFDMIAGKAVLALVRNREEVEDLNEEFTDTNRQLDKMNEIMKEGLVGEWKALTSATEGLKTNIGEAFGPTVIVGIKKASDMVRNMSDSVTFFRAILGQKGLLGSKEEILGNLDAINQLTSKMEYIRTLEYEEEKIWGKSKESKAKRKALKEQIKNQVRALELMGGMERYQLNGIGLYQAQTRLIKERDEAESKARANAKKAIEDAKKKKQLEEDAEKARLEKLTKEEADEERRKQRARDAEAMEKRRLAIVKSGLEQEKDMKQSQMDFEDMLVDEEIANINKLHDHKLALQLSEADHIKAWNEEQKEIANAKTQAIVASINAVAQVSNAWFSKEISQINAKTQAEIDAVNNRDKKMTEAERKKQAEITAIKKKGAKEALKLQEAQWAVQGMQIASTGALATMRAYSDLGPIAGTAAAIAMGVTTAANMGVWAMNKPEMPAFASGGVVGGFGGATVGGDNTMASLREGEMVLNAGQQRELFNIANGNTTNNSNVTIVVNESATPQLTAEAVMEKWEEANRLGMGRS